MVLGDNQLTGICLWMDTDGPEDHDSESHGPGHKSKLLFPNLSALDVSNNKIREAYINIVFF